MGKISRATVGSCEQILRIEGEKMGHQKSNRPCITHQNNIEPLIKHGPAQSHETHLQRNGGLLPQIEEKDALSQTTESPPAQNPQFLYHPRCFLLRY